MKQRIIDLLDKKDLSLSWEEIKDQLHLTDVEELKELSETLQELAEEYVIHYTGKKKYMLFKYSHLSKNVVKGIFSTTHHDYGFVRVDGEEEDIFVHVSNSMGAVNDDVVLVEKYENFKDKKIEGRILKILQRTNEAHVGKVTINNNKIVVVLDNKKFKEPVYIRDETKKGLVEGHKVLVKLLNKDNGKDLSGTVTKVIGHINDPGIDILSIAYEHGFDADFSPETIEELKNIPDSLTEDDIAKELKNGRRDLRDQMIFTIDGDNTKDVDDAISLEKLPNGNYKLGVHIADVSYYVKEGSSLFKDAYLRGTSVYMINYVLPMFPHLLSNGICSLNEGVDRYTISGVMEINPKGIVVNEEIFPAIIKSRKKMTYSKVNSILEKNIVPEDYEVYKNNLFIMKDLSQILRKMKEERGAIDFDLDEPEILVDENGNPYDIVKRYRGIAEKLIEDLMVQDNETVAIYMKKLGIPVMFRVHGKPDVFRLLEVVEFIKTLGYKVDIDMKKITSKTIQQLLNSLRDKKEFPILSSQILRCMEKAIYSENNTGHFAIASKCYLHFTSDIRRFEDFGDHTIVRTTLFENKFNEETISHYEKMVSDWALQASIKERDADDAEREANALYMAKYMGNHIGEQYHGMISGVTNFGIFVRLDNLVEGLVPIDELGPYTYNEKLQSLIDKNKKICYRLCDELDVEVTRVSLEKRTIDFKVIKRIDNNEKEDQNKVKAKTRYS